MIKAMEIPSLAESKYHGANSLKTLSDPVSFILNLMPGDAKQRLERGVAGMRGWGGGGWPLLLGSLGSTGGQRGLRPPLRATECPRVPMHQL